MAGEVVVDVPEPFVFELPLSSGAKTVGQYL